MGYRIGIDVGGTFTDYLLLRPDGSTHVHKVLSSPADPSEAVLRGLADLADVAGTPLARFLRQVDIIVHGTTVTTNAVLTGNTARTGLLTTQGFRDALEMRRGVREAFYDNKFTAPAALVPRRMRLPVRGRMDHEGREIEALHLEDVELAIAELQSREVEAVAICFMHSYANPAHEEAAAQLVAKRMPGAYLSVSNRVLPQVRFYERSSTTVLNAVVGPILQRYMQNLRRRLSESGFDGVLRIMQSNGGVTSPEAVAALAASTLLSGPAAAPTAGLAAMQPHDEDTFITIDMGGTSFDAAMVAGGQPSITTSGSVNRFALALPSMEINTIGAGGGSIAWIDHGMLRMGPQSAGAVPGPACYGNGGEQPTCSDANLVLGYLSPQFFAGGRIKLDPQAALDAITARVARPLGMDPVRAAYGMYHVMNVNMASAIREISVQKGWDPRKFPLICAGGAGAVHAAMIARELGIRRIVVPREASIFCASGMLQTDLKHDFVRSYATILSQASVDRVHLGSLLDAMMEEAHGVLASEGLAPQQRRFAHTVDLRYLGQYHEVSVETTAAQLRGGAWDAIREAFHDRHDRLFGYALREDDAVVELVSIRITALGSTDKPAPVHEPLSDAGVEHLRKGRRSVYQPQSGEFAQTPVYDGDRLRHGNRLEGPAMIEKVTTSIFVPAGFTLSVDAFGGCVLEDRAIEGARMISTVDTAAQVDPIEASVLHRRLKSITEEMGLTLLRTTRSPILNEARDFVTGLYDAKGQMLEQTEYIPVLAFALQPACEHIVQFFGADIHEGDVILHNDVFSGGNQNNDVAVFRPIFRSGKLAAWAACKGHQADIGGAQAGGYNPEAREVWQEALRITPVKIYAAGELRRDVWRMIFANIRYRIVEEDIKAQIGATRVGERGMQDLFRRFDDKRFDACIAYLFAAAERMVRREITAIADGVYRAESWAFYDGVNDGSRMKINLAVSVAGDEVTFDFTGSSPQTPGFVNAPYAATASALLLTFLMLINPDVPHNAGLLRAIRIVNPEGSFLNARFPAATTFGNSITGPISDAIFRAFAQALPKMVSAGWNRMMGFTVTGDDPRHARPYVDILFLALKGGSGATWSADGYNHIGLINCAGGILAQDYEMFEIHDPHRLVRHEYALDSAGAGRWRGGLGVETEFLIDGENVTGIAFGDGVEEDARAFGLFGGKPGSINAIEIGYPDGSAVKPKAKSIIRNIPRGAVYRQRAGGGGGYGDPHERDEQLVLADVLDGVLSVQAARDDYGVVIDAASLALDPSATRLLRGRP